MTAIRCIVSGHVQGVFFRASTRQVADSLGLAGHAINLPDGRVEVLASGAMESLERLKDYIRTGPSGASVTSVACEPWNGPVPESFTIG
ncbi:MAG: acylphosphatase [Chromatiales bacterium]